MPMEILRERAQDDVNKDLIAQELADRIIQVIASERGGDATINEVQGVSEAPAAVASTGLSTKLSEDQMKELLTQREAMMRQGQVRDGGADEGVSDQARVYSEIIDALQRGQRLRLMVQASARDFHLFRMVSELLLRSPRVRCVRGMWCSSVV